MRNTKAISLGEAIESFFETYDLKSKFNETGLIASWEKIMGKTIASRTEKIYVRDKKLFLKISSAPLRQELRMAQSQLVSLINKEMKAEVIEDVVFI